MRNVTTLVAPTVEQIGIQRPSQRLDTQAAWQINDIFKSLQATFPAWRNSLQTPEEARIAKKVFTKGLMESGVTSIAEIQLGMKQARASGSAFFPSIGQFIGWCKPMPEDFGLLSVGEAYIAACNGNGKNNEAVHHAAIATGPFDLRRSTSGDNVCKRFEYNYAVVVRRVMNGEQLGQPITKAIENSDSMAATQRKAPLPEKEYKAMVSSCFSDMLKGL